MLRSVIALFLLISFGHSLGAIHTVNPITENAGLFYEPLHQVRFTRAEWKLVTSINLEPLEDMHNYFRIDPTLKNMYNACLIVNFESQCANALNSKTIEYKQYRITTLMTQIDSILSYPQRSTETTRRAAPFGFIGSLSKLLFGVMDANDAEHYNQELDNLYSDQKKLSQVLANQTHVIKSSLHSAQEQILKEINENHKLEARLNAELEKLKYGYNDTRNELYLAALRQYSNRMEIHQDDYIQSMETIINSVLFAKMGSIHPELIAPKRIEHAIRTFIEHERTYVFPIPVEELHNGELEKIATISMTHHSNKLIVVIKMPLLESTVYHLYHLHPHPTPQLMGNNTGSAYVQPRAKYLIMSKGLEKYSLLPSITQPMCQRTHYQYICTPCYPLYDTAMQPICEASLLSNTVRNPHEDCDVRMSKSFNPHWQHLSHSKGWLYSLPEETSIQIICGDANVKTLKLKDAGVLHLDPGCTGKTLYATIMGYQVIEKSIALDLQTTPTVALNISILLPRIDNWESYFTTKTRSDAPRITSFANIPGALSYDATFGEFEQQLIELSTHRRSEQKRTEILYYTSGAIGSLAIIFLVYMLRHCFVTCLTTICCCMCTKKKKKIATVERGEKLIDTPENIVKEESTYKFGNRSRSTARGNKSF